MTIAQIRVFLMVGWPVCLAFVALLYAYSFFSPSPQFRPPASQILSSFGTVVGLLAPHITLTLNFFIKNPHTSNRRLPKKVAHMLIAMCLGYWILFICLLWVGIVNRSFGTLGVGISSATSIVVAISGLLSFLVVVPTAKIFSNEV